MSFDFIPEPTRMAGLATLMKGAGKLTRLLPIPQPTLLVGAGASARLGQAIAGFGHRKLFIVTDAVVAKLGLLTPLTEALQAGGASFVVFDEITPDAPIPLIERGIARFEESGCDALVAVGGGSAIDSAKAIALAVANPGKALRQLAGYFKGLRTPLPLYAVPTTAGTGSEVTVAAVVADPERESKIVIVDTRMVPRMAALDAALMTGLPPAVTAATGVDALTHAIEAFVGQWATDHTDGLALAAVGMIFRHLPRAYAQGSDLEAREQMALASTYAGMAFTRANVGYVHAIAHQLGGKYHTPHGLANAIVLPHVLRFSAPAIGPRLAQLAQRAGLGQADEREAVLAKKFLDGVDALNAGLGIPRHLAALKAADIPALATAALHEAHTGYPVPRYMTQKICEELLRKLLPPQTEVGADVAKADGSATSQATGRVTARGEGRARPTAATAPAPTRAPARKASARARPAVPSAAADAGSASAAASASMPARKRPRAAA